MKQFLSRAWRLFVNVATIFSFTVNLILVLVLVLAVGPLRQLLTDLDRAFQALGETSVTTAVPVEEAIGIGFQLPLNQPLGLDFDLPIGQETEVVLTQPVPLTNLPATFNLYGSGMIRGNVTLTLPPGMRLPVRLDMVVPVESTIPVSMTVPVSQSVPVSMTIPVSIQLGQAGLEPAVRQLQGVFSPLRALVDEADETLAMFGIH